MDRPAIVIRDIQRYGDNLTAPEAIGRLCGGGPVTVTVTDPARRRPARQPAPRLRHHRQARPRRPAGAAAGDLLGRTHLRAPAVTALFAEALALASQLAGCTELGESFSIKLPATISNIAAAKLKLPSAMVNSDAPGAT